MGECQKSMIYGNLLLIYPGQWKTPLCRKSPGLKARILNQTTNCRKRNDHQNLTGKTGIFKAKGMKIKVRQLAKESNN